jgi:hypothetical protein
MVRIRVGKGKDNLYWFEMNGDATPGGICITSENPGRLTVAKNSRVLDQAKRVAARLGVF